MELVDDEHIQLGINGVATMTVSKNDLGSWPFEKAAMPSNKLGCRGLFLVFARIRQEKQHLSIQLSYP